MTQLKNTIFNFPSLEKDGYIIKDFSRNNLLKIKDLPESNNENFITWIHLEDNQTIEAISYLLYSNENYWDILLAINGIDPLYGMAYSFDVIADISKARVAKYETEISKKVLDTKRRDELIAQFNIEIDAQNEKNRIFKVIKPFRMNDFIKILKDSGYIIK